MLKSFVVALSMAIVATGFVGDSPVAAASASEHLEVSGHGWGHGRGMGQYGAYGYAQKGWTSAQILDHYYQGTTAGPIPANAPVDPNNVRVELRFMRGRPTAAALGQGTILLRGSDDADLGQITAGAVRLVRSGDGYQVETAASCAGPWAAHSTIPGRSMVRLLASSAASGHDALLQGCGVGYRSWYEGELQAAMDGVLPVTVNKVTIEQYLRGVVPNEMPASWPYPALEAQAVAARSYAMAGDTRQQPYADTCDSIRCQVYDGSYTERGGFRSSSHHRTDIAILATTGQVRIATGGGVARTEFSSSTGGYTAGGTFPAVVDAGDSIAINPNHSWTTSVPVSRLENKFRLGSFRSAEVTRRTGLGPDGGRVLEVELVFSGGRTTATGNTMRTVLGLKSDWFTFGPGSGSDLRGTRPGSYIDAMFKKLVGRSASNGELIDWSAIVESGDRRALTDRLVRSDHFTGALVDDLYQRAFGRAADSPGRAYWVAEVGKGLHLRVVGVLFYGSPEYYQRSGNSDQALVDALYRDVLGRQPDDEGRRYWLATLADDRVGLDDVAAGFYDSLESRTTRAVGLHQDLVGSTPSPPTSRELADRLLSVDDVVLASEIAASAAAYGS
jgi:SpoIID/LytB domain protein